MAPALAANPVIAAPRMRDTYAYFWLKEFDLHVDDVTRAMGIAPSRAWNRGQPGSYREEMSYSGWDLNSPLGRGDHDVHAHIDALLGVLEARAAVVRSMADRYEAGISCIGFFSAVDPTFHLSRATIARVAALGLCVDFELECVHDEEQSP